MTPEQSVSIARVTAALARTNFKLKTPYVGKYGDVFLRVGSRHFCIIEKDGTIRIPGKATEYQRYLLSGMGGVPWETPVSEK